jgi:hypothetical protein
MLASLLRVEAKSSPGYNNRQRAAGLNHLHGASFWWIGQFSHAKQVLPLKWVSPGNGAVIDLRLGKLCLPFYHYVPVTAS